MKENNFMKEIIHCIDQIERRIHKTINHIEQIIIDIEQTNTINGIKELLRKSPYWILKLQRVRSDKKDDIKEKLIKSYTSQKDQLVIDLNSIHLLKSQIKNSEIKTTPGFIRRKILNSPNATTIKQILRKIIKLQEYEDYPRGKHFKGEFLQRLSDIEQFHGWSDSDRLDEIRSRICTALVEKEIQNIIYNVEVARATDEDFSIDIALEKMENCLQDWFELHKLSTNLQSTWNKDYRKYTQLSIKNEIKFTEGINLINQLTQQEIKFYSKTKPLYNSIKKQIEELKDIISFNDGQPFSILRYDQNKFIDLIYNLFRRYSTTNEEIIERDGSGSRERIWLSLRRESMIEDTESPFYLILNPERKSIDISKNQLIKLNKNNNTIIHAIQSSRYDILTTIQENRDKLSNLNDLTYINNFVRIFPNTNSNKFVFQIGDVCAFYSRGTITLLKEKTFVKHKQIFSIFKHLQPYEDATVAQRIIKSCRYYNIKDEANSFIYNLLLMKPHLQEQKKILERILYSSRRNKGESTLKRNLIALSRGLEYCLRHNQFDFEAELFLKTFDHDSHCQLELKLLDKNTSTIHTIVATDFMRDYLLEIFALYHTHRFRITMISDEKMKITPIYDGE